jgi:hypothetical protein
LPLVVSLWSILALSGTLAGETQRGSLDFVAATGRSRRRVALEKLSGHVLMLGLAVLVAFVSIAYADSAFASLPGDEINVLSASALMFAGFIVNGYQVAVPELAPFANVTWWGWTQNHIALAGQYDWPSVVLVAVVAVVLLAIVARRDLRS